MSPPPPIRRKPVPSPARPHQSQDPLRPGWEKDITRQFRQALSTERMKQFRRASSQRPTRTNSSRSLPPSYATSQRSSRPPQNVPRYGTGDDLAPDQANIDDFSYGRTPATSQTLANLPITSTAPATQAEIQFRNQLIALSETPLKWENPGLLDEAMRMIPLERIYAEAEDEAALLVATAESMGSNLKAKWDLQDCIIRALLKWFRKEFFQWISNPPCSRCGFQTVAVGHVAPVPEEVALSAQKVELYKCASGNCGSYERFPRYNDAFVLMQTRRGRVGEWANCFTMLCRSMGSRVRWVWNSEDYVWAEVYSEYRKRWIHVDPCEGVWDNPTLYINPGWGKKLGYCIAFSAEGAMDVTLRYCRNPVKCGLPRTRCSEAVLQYILDEIRQLRRRDKPKDEKFNLEGEDRRETHELRHYYISALVDDLCNLVPGGRRSRRQNDADARKAAERAAEAAARNTAMRTPEGETGPQGPTTQPPS